MAALLLGAALLTACSDDNTDPAGHFPAVDVSSKGKTLVPNATGADGESGTTRAYIGTVVTAEGFNLDRVSRVTLGGAEAEIVEQTISMLKFKVPALELAQSDDAYRQDLLVYGADGETVIFRYDYYVTVPVTDALVSGYSPAEGTVGTVVKIEGRNLEQVTEVRFADYAVGSDAFVESSAEALTFAVPAGAYAAGESEVAIAALWGGDKRIDVTGDTPFRMQTPKPDAVSQPEGESAVIGGELVITGEFLDLVREIKWGSYELIVLEQTASSLTVKFPSSIEPAQPIVAAADIAGVFGEPAQKVVLAAGYRLDTTPQGPAKPVFKSLEAEDGGADNKLYLGKVVTVKGDNMASIEGFLVGGVRAELAGEPNDVEAKFVVPDGMEFDTAAEVSLEAVYGGGTKVDFGTVTVYPFYYWKDVKLGSGSSSKTNYPYPEFAWTNSFFLPDTGRVISAEEWVMESIDPFAKLSSSNAAIKSGSTLNKENITAEQYYAVSPYIFCTTGSDGKLAFQNPANSASQLKTHRYEEGQTSVSTTYGTPVIFYLVLKSGEEYDAAKAGTLTTLTTIEKVAGSSAPAFGDSRNFVAGDVLAVHYVTYTKGAKPAAAEDVHKQGYMVVTEVTCGDAAAGKATDLNGYVKFDFYWSKTLNE